MTSYADRPGRDFIARHGETVFNAARRLQGDHPHTPLTHAGFAQAHEMGAALRELLGAKPKLTMYASNTGRALQTLAVISEHLELDWHDAHHDPRLVEIGTGSWGGRYYDDLMAELGDAGVIAPTGLLQVAPDGEDYRMIATRVSSWLDDTNDDPGDRLVIMHGISSRVLRGVMTGADTHPDFGARIALGLPQGSIALIDHGVETIPHLGKGRAPA